MKKRLISALLALCLLINMSGALASGFVLPAALTQIDEQAFSDCESISGLLCIPERASTVGAQAFAGADIFALETADGVASVDADAFGGSPLCYILVRGDDTQIPAALAETAVYVFASQDSAAWGKSSTAEYIDLERIAVFNGFCYEIGVGGARLLCAVDNSALPSEITVPSVVSGAVVTEISESAFLGCEGIRILHLPEDVSIADGALDALGQATVDYYVPGTLTRPAFDSVSSNGNSVFMDWTYTADAEGYYVFRSTSESGPFTLIDTLENHGHEYNPKLYCSDGGLPVNTTWYYALQAYADGGMKVSALSEICKAQIGNEPLGKPQLAEWYGAWYHGITPNLIVQRAEGDGIYRTDVYRSLDPFVEFELVDTLEGSEAHFADVEFPFGTVVYYRLQTFASIGGVNYTSEMSDLFTLEMDGDTETWDVTLSTRLCAEGPALHIYSTTNGKVFDIYRSDSMDGPYTKIDTVTITTGYDNDIYSGCNVLLSDDALQTGAYYKVHERLPGGSFGKRSNATYVSAKQDYQITLVPDVTSCETGAEVSWTLDIPEEARVSSYGYIVYVDGEEYLSKLGYGQTSTFTYALPVDGVYTLKARIRMNDLNDKSTEVEVESSASVTATTAMGSNHPYTYDDHGYYWFDGEIDSGYQLVTFSTLCDFSASNTAKDCVTILDEWDNEIGTYYGTELAGQTIKVPGSGVGIDFYAPINNDDFGFAIVKMESKPHLELKAKGIDASAAAVTTSEGVTWTANVEDGCEPFTVNWDIYKDGALFDSITCRDLSLTYYPPAAGVYCAKATVSDNLYSVTMTSANCSVAQQYAPASDFTYTVNTYGHCVTITGYTGNADVVCIPDTIEGYSVIAIERLAFENSTVSAWILPDSIETIGISAFRGAKMHSIRLPENAYLTLGAYCFSKTENLTRISFPKYLTAIPERCFEYSGLESVYIPETIKTLGFASFFHCDQLREISFAPEGLTAIPNACFEYCDLSRVVLPKTVTSVGDLAFADKNTRREFEVWAGASVTSLPDLLLYDVEPFPSGAVVYAPEGSYAANWARRFEGEAYAFSSVYYGGSGCEEMFGGEHDYAPVSDVVSLNPDSGLHMHDVDYACVRCGHEKSEQQAQTALGCWRCEAKAEYGSGASIPANKFEFLDRYKLDGDIYYRIRLLADHNGVKAGHEALFVDEELKIVTTRATINTLFRTHMYTGSGTLPWEYTETTSDYPSLERRAELVSSSLSNAQNNLALAEEFMKSDLKMENIGEAASVALNVIWGNPGGALESMKNAVVPSMDILLVLVHLTLLNKLAESTTYDVQHYNNSLENIIDKSGYIVCENAEISLQTFANCMSMWQLCTDNSSGIIEEIAACDSAFGVGVRNIMTMLKGAVGINDNPYAKTGVLVTQTMYTALTSADEDGEANTDLVIKYIGDLAAIAADVSKSSCLGTMVDLYKSGTFSLSQFLYVDGAMEKYEKTYNAFCLNNSTPLYQAHDALAGA